ncbi:MAG: hypothetical protein M1827_006470 [Pycnora praestabilis]|nr:MAG: hypothetical protein M1827_006470 [Pycnora praestabilis]
MEFLIRFVQVHEGFRRPEIHALADLLNVPIAFLTYSEDSPFSIVRLPSEASAAALISRSILTHAIYSLIGSGSTYPDLHDLIRTHAIPQWPSSLLKSSFKFNVDAYRGKHDLDAQRALIESFSYLPISGPIRMRDPACEFVISEDWSFEGRELRQVYLGRLVASSQRHEALSRYDLKKRTYISTTSMDSELALVTANLTLAGPGKLFYDPFVGTGSFPIACAHFGAMAVGSDIDGRSVRGKKKEKGGEGGMMGTKPKNDKNIVGNFRQYGLQGRWLGGFIADLTNCPLRVGRGGEDTPLFDGIVCDPPYGVREGLKVLGSRDGRGTKEAVFIDGKAAHL